MDMAALSLQMAIRHPSLAACFILADCGAAFPEARREAFRRLFEYRQTLDRDDALNACREHVASICCLPEKVVSLVMV